MIWRECILCGHRPCSFKLMISELDEEESVLRFCSLICLRKFINSRLGLKED